MSVLVTKDWDETSPNLMLESMDEYLEEFQSTKQMNEIVGYTLSGILAFIGILNFLNTTVTSIFARKKEFAMMQSVGMTGSQLKKMLLLEGIFYVGAAAVAIPMGCYRMLSRMSIVERLREAE